MRNPKGKTDLITRLVKKNCAFSCLRCQVGGKL